MSITNNKLNSWPFLENHPFLRNSMGSTGNQLGLHVNHFLELHSVQVLLKYQRHMQMGCVLPGIGNILSPSVAHQTHCYQSQK